MNAKRRKEQKNRSLYWKRLWCTGRDKGSRALRRQWLTGILLQRGLWTVAQIAETLCVSKATCQRDLYLLADLFHVREVIDPRHSQRTCYQMIGTFKPTIGAFPMRKLKRRTFSRK
jgi:hypothetical protein